MHRRQMARFGALLFGGGAAVTALGLVLPHEAQVDEAGLAAVAAGAALGAAALVLSGERLPRWAFQLVATAGTVFVSLALLFNGERSGGPAGGDEMYYLWVVLYAAYFLGPDRNGDAGGRDRPGLRRHADRDRPRSDRGQQMAQHGRAGGRIGCRRPPAERPRCEAGRRASSGWPAPII